MTAFNSASSQFGTFNGYAEVHIKGIVTTGANAGNLTTQILNPGGTGSTLTVYINSYMKVWKVA